MARIEIVEFFHRPKGPGENNNGWYFGSGYPEFWKYKDRLVKPGGRVLDLGSGRGTMSVFFALHGMEVVSFDTNISHVQQQKRLVQKYNLPIDVRRQDIRDAKFLGKFDVVVASLVFFHFTPKSSAFEVLDKTLSALVPEGHLWLRAVGKEDQTFQRNMHDCLDPEAAILDEDTLIMTCDCSGEERLEPFLFFGQTELLQYCLLKHMRIIHSQLMPSQGVFNIMYGEDWPNPVPFWEKRGMISILAQK